MRGTPPELMTGQILSSGLQYSIYILEGVVCVLLVARGSWRHLRGLCLYIGLLFAVDGIGRSAVLSYFGERSIQYFYFYWLTDVALALGAFLLTCSFFHRACAQEEKLWRLVRQMLQFVFLLVVAISVLILTRHMNRLNARGFMVEFSQNLYFSCLVLNTLLFVMIQQLAIADDELGLLVCGLGVQFAGEAAGLALYHLTLGQGISPLLFSILNPVCSLGMLLIWGYAIVKTQKTVQVDTLAGEHTALAEAVSN